MKKNNILLWLMLFVALLGGSYMVYHLVLPIRIIYHVAVLSGLALFLYKRGLPSSPMTLAALALCAALALSIPNAIDPRMAFENGWNWFVNFLVMLVFIQLLRDGYDAVLFRAHFLAGGIVALGAIIEWLFTRGRPLGIFLNISLTGAYCAALIIPAFNAVRERAGIHRLKYLGLVGILLIAIVVGDNRGALLNVGVATLVYLLATWRLKRVVYVALSVGGSAILISLLLIMSLRPEHADGDSVRLDLWRAGGEMLNDYTFGVGPGLYAQAYRDIGQSGERRFADAHNTIITLGAELGGPGILAGFAILLAFIYCLPNVKLSHAQWAALAALIGICAHSMVDSFPSDNWAILIGLYVAYVVRDAQLDLGQMPRKALTVMAMVALLFWTTRMLQFDQAQMAFESALNTGDYADAFKAHELDPDMKLYDVELFRLKNISALPLDENLPLYGLIMYGRRFK